MIEAFEPLVSCIMPTYNRRAFVPFAIRYFLRQQYKNKELVIIDDGSDAVEDLIPASAAIRYYRLEKKITLGAKLNLACSYAAGNILVNWDDDDWYAPWRLPYQVQALQANGAGVCGINKLLYYDPGNKKAFHYIYPPDQRVWLLGSSLCYTRELWNKNRFAEIDVGMDGLFVWNTPPAQVAPLDNNRFSVHMIHAANVSPKQTDGAWWHTYSAEEIQQIMGADWELYQTAPPLRQPEVNGHEQPAAGGSTESSTLRNVYACLVHESPDCIRDLVQNLRYQDPDSVILLYNGSQDATLIRKEPLFDRMGVVVHPHPSPAVHGYLHKFALDCMQFSLDNLPFDCLTIVDSDQLAVRKGYPAYLSQFVSATGRVGLLSGSPERVQSHHTANHVALQAFREYDLWKPLLQLFDKGEDKFVHWTFWPSTVFMRDAARDLVKLFREHELLNRIMARSRIWATEEVILPTLVRLLNYEIGANPCSYDFVRYKIPVRREEIDLALQQEKVYWLHPVARNINDPLRRLLRERWHDYQSGNGLPPDTAEAAGNGAERADILNKIHTIQGWLSTAEAALLIEITRKACSLLPAPHTLVEVGSYHGKATVVIGTVISQDFPRARVVSIDPHDGRLGAADQGLKVFPPSLEAFRRNIAAAGLAPVVEIIRDHCQRVVWNEPLSLLLIDGLHDYVNVSGDFRHFAAWIRPGGFVAFHDYADYFPGVKVFVHELLQSGAYRKTALADSLIVLQRIGNELNLV